MFQGAPSRQTQQLSQASNPQLLNDGMKKSDLMGDFHVAPSVHSHLTGYGVLRDDGQISGNPRQDTGAVTVGSFGTATHRSFGIPRCICK